MVELLGAQQLDHTYPPQRGLQLDKSQKITNYIELLKKLFIHHNILQKEKAMERNMTKNITKEEMNRVDKECSRLDKERVR